MTIEARVRSAVLSAIDARGFLGVTYEGVAAASGVAKTTLYRHWPTKAELIFAMVMHGRPQQPLDCTPSLEGASRALARRVAQFLGEPVSARAMPHVLLEMANDPPLAKRLRADLVARGCVEIEQMLDRCGLAPIDGLDAGDVQMVLLGATQSWLTVAGLPASEIEDRLTVVARALLRERP